MKLPINCLSFFLLFTVACGDSPETKQGEPAGPKALQDNNSSSGVFSKRSYDNVVDQLYAEIVEEDTALDQHERAIDALSETKKDSLRAFHSFDQKNNSYYQSAKILVENIPDSMMRKFADSVLSSSIKKYNTLVSSHEQLERQIEEQARLLESAHRLCKIAYTLPVIEEFQVQLPPLTALERYQKQLNNITQKTTLLTNKKLK